MGDSTYQTIFSRILSILYKTLNLIELKIDFSNLIWESA